MKQNESLTSRIHFPTLNQLIDIDGIVQNIHNNMEKERDEKLCMLKKNSLCTYSNRFLLHKSTSAYYIFSFRRKIITYTHEIY